MTTHRHGEPVTKETPNLITDRLNKLKRLFPDAFSEGAVDLDMLRVSVEDLGDDAITGSEHYAFT